MAPLPRNLTVFIALACAAIFLATIMILALTMSFGFFIILFSLYMVGCTAFTYAYLLMKKKEVANDVNYQSASYIALFNTIFSFFVFIIAIVLMFSRARLNGFRRGAFGAPYSSASSAL